MSSHILYFGVSRKLVVCESFENFHIFLIYVFNGRMYFFSFAMHTYFAMPILYICPVSDL